MLHYLCILLKMSVASQIDLETANRRSRLIKRRYKSGLPLSTERNEDDFIEESYLKRYGENFQKTSKDDSGKSNIV